MLEVNTESSRLKYTHETGASVEVDEQGYIKVHGLLGSIVDLDTEGNVKIQGKNVSIIGTDTCTMGSSSPPMTILGSEVNIN